MLKMIQTKFGLSLLAVVLCLVYSLPSEAITFGKLCRRSMAAVGIRNSLPFSLQEKDPVRTLEDSDFWKNFKAELLLQDIDPTYPNPEEGAVHIFSAFGREATKLEDRQWLQALLERLGVLFSQPTLENPFSSIAQNALSSSYGLNLPPEAHEKVTKSRLFKKDDLGATKLKILQTFVVNKMLKRGDPREASNLILSETQPPSHRKRGYIDHSSLNDTHPDLLGTLLHPETSFLKIPLRRLFLEIRRAGKRGTVPALLRPTLELYVVYVRQYKKTGPSETPLFFDLPEKFQEIALRQMNSLDRTQAKPEEGKAETQVLKPKDGKWTADFIRVLENIAPEKKVDVFGENAKSRAQFSNAEKMKLIEANLGTHDSWIFKTGLEVAIAEWKKDLEAKRDELRRIIYEDLESAYQDYISAGQKISDRKESLGKDSARWTLPTKERGELEDSEATSLKQEWKRIEIEAIIKFATRAAKAMFLAELTGVQINPQYMKAFDRDPRLRAAVLEALKAAEVSQTEKSREDGINNFRNALRPDSREAIFSEGSAGFFPLGKKVLQSYRAKAYVERGPALQGFITKMSAIVASTLIIYGGFNTFKKQIETPPVTEAIVWRLTRENIDPQNLLTDETYQREKGRFIASALADGLKEADAELLRTFVRDTNPERLPKDLQLPFANMKNHTKAPQVNGQSDPNAVDWSLFDDFKNWEGNRYQSWGREMTVPAEVRRVRVTALNLVLNAMRYQNWVYSQARLMADKELSKALYEEAIKQAERAGNMLRAESPDPANSTTTSPQEASPPTENK